jgi:hypothetical protein
MSSEAVPLADNRNLLAEEFERGYHAVHFRDLALGTKQYDRNVALELLAAGKGQSGESWGERCLALLLLENQLLRLAPDQLDEFDAILVALGLKPEPGWDVPVRPSVLREGFSSTQFPQFVSELIQRLRRLHRLHQPILEGVCSQDAWEYFARVARDAAKVTLSRYVFTSEEVFRRVVGLLRLTEGTDDVIPRYEEDLAARWAYEAVEFPDFEREIVNKLCAGRNIYWLSQQCCSELNSLVEYPLTSAVVVVKPPGSDLEIEFKRAGVHGARLLNVITERDGVSAPTSHRLYGGSLGWLARREAAAAGIFARIYELVHGSTAPCCRTVSNTSIVTVPAINGETHLLDYLTDDAQFGDGFEQTRQAMKVCVEKFPSDTGVARAAYADEPGLTLQFIGQALPQQAVIVGSSSFRLDRILLYLSDSGPEEYFRNGLGRDFEPQDGRWLADSVLEEILCEVMPPPDGYTEHSSYVRDAFRVPENRRRADENFLSVMRQIGECWGTLLAVRGFSDGESFVLRNVGLKSVWKNGGWRIRIIFMDHDDLTVAGSRYRYLWPWREAGGMELDLIHILGGRMDDEDLPGEVGALKSIYRVSAGTGEAGLASLEDAVAAAYHQTKSQLATNQQLRDLFYPAFLKGHRDFDELLPSLLQTSPSEEESWTIEAQSTLRKKLYGEELVAEYTKALRSRRKSFERISFLYSR